MATGIVALSFAKRIVEPNPVNRRLAAITDSIDDELQSGGEMTMIVAQWEIALALPVQPQRIVRPEDARPKPDGSTYLDSQDVLDKAFEIFRLYEITDVVVIANRFIHRRVVESMVRSAGFKVVKAKIPTVGFDSSSENLQWWCKGPVRMIIYSGIQVIGKIMRKDLHGIGEKSATK